MPHAWRNTNQICFLKLASGIALYNALNSDTMAVTLINRPGEAGAVLQTPLSLIN